MKRAMCSALAALGCLLVARAPGQSIGQQVRQLLPVGDLQVDVLQPWSPPRLAVLTEKLQTAARADPAWFRAHAATAAPGTPLPYHPKLGLTESEYHEFLALADSVQMRSAATGSLHVESTPSGWRISERSTIAALRGLQIDTLANVVRSSFGILGAADPIVPSDAQRATGRWGGPRWALEAVDASTITGAVATFAIGRLAATGQRVVYFDAKRAANGQITARESIFLLAAP